MNIPPDDAERIERQRFRNRCINVAWLIFIFSPLLFLWLAWLPTGLTNIQATLQYLVSLFR